MTATRTALRSREPRSMTGTLDPSIAAALRPLLALVVPVLAPLVARELAAKGQHSADADDPWIDQGASPLGKRTHCRACAEGRIEGAYKLKRRWLARRSAIDAYIAEHGRAPVEVAPTSGIRERDDAEPTAEDIARELAAAGLAYTPRRTGGRR